MRFFRNKRSLALLMACVLALGLCLSGCGHTHEFGEWTVTTAATCTTAGEEARSCECGETETRELAASGHNFGEWTVISEADCVNDGERERICADCGETETETVAALGHSFAPATYFAPKTCANCGETEGKALATVLTVGETTEREDSVFTLEEIYFTEKVSEKHGNVTYSYGGRGSFNLVLKLNFQNLSTEALDSYGDRFEDMELVYMDKYEYEGEYRILGDDIVPLAEGYVYVIFPVPESMEGDENGSLIASFKLDGEVYAVVINEGSASGETAEGPGSDGQFNPELQVGTESSGDEYSFVLEDAFFTDKLSEKHGNVTYSYGGSGGYFYVLKLDFTNLSTETLSSYNDRVDDMKLVYNDKYNYDGEFRILGDDIVPLANGYVYVVFTVPESMENDDSGSIMAYFSVDGDDYSLDCGV